MKFYDESAKLLTEKQLEVYENLLSYVPAIKEVVGRFDGKVLNKRFDTALRQATDGKASCTKKTYVDGYELALHEYNDRCIIVDGHGAYYIKQDAIILADTLWRSKTWINAEGRIVADELIAVIDSAAERAAKNAKSLKEQLDSVDSLIAEYERIASELHGFEINTNYLLREYFGLKF